MIRKFNKKYRRIVEAVQWNATQESLEDLMDMGLRDWEPGEMGSCTFYIEALGNKHLISYGDWVIKDVQGKFFSCKPDVFDKTYVELNKKVEEVK
jgi:hypothetical protein